MKKLNNTQGSILAVRAQLQRSSTDVAEQLRRSVGRASSVDYLPCTEYGAEVTRQRALVEELLFLQHCRSALERAVASGCSRLVWHWQDGSTAEVRFRRQNHHVTMTVRHQTAA